jgi:tetratricopeptide (TPR) repeat protein/TolB-like protein
MYGGRAALMGHRFASLGGNAETPPHSAISVALLPYECENDGILGGDFAPRMTVVVNRALMQFANLKVTYAGTTLRLGGTRRSRDALGKTLGVKYLIEGCIDRVDQILSFKHVVHDTEAGKRWALPSVEVHISNLHGAGIWVAPQIMRALVPDLHEFELERVLSGDRGSPGAQDFLLRALMAIQRLTRKSLDEAEDLLIRAQVIDPSFASAFAWHARVCSLRIGQGWTDDAAEMGHRANQLANTAIDLDPRNAVALAVAGHMRSYLCREYEAGLELCDRAIAACSNEPLAWIMSSVALAYLGDGREGLRRANYGMSLSPLDRLAFLHQAYAAVSAYVAGDYVETLRLARLSLADNPNYTANVRTIACVLVGLGEIQEARRYGAQLLRMQPDYARDYERLILFRDPLVRERAFKHLQTAGVIPPRQHL